MCIIIAKQQGVTFPNKKILQTCFLNNPHGAGFMWSDGKQVFYKKGYMTFTKFYKDLREIREKYGDNIPYVLHFRIATQGGINARCCHPFPISSNMLDLEVLNGECDVALAHNGIISSCSNGYQVTITYSDTMKFITDYASLIINDYQYYNDKDKCKLLERIADSRLAILSKDKHIEILGKGWVKDNGILYSNTSYIPYTYKYSKYYIAEDYDVEEIYHYYPQTCPNITDGNINYCEQCISKNICWQE